MGQVPVCFDGELGARVDAELAKDVYQMGLDGGARDKELPGYLGVGKAPSGQADDLEFGRNNEACPSGAGPTALPAVPG